jgi:hypothetical protein
METEIISCEPATPWSWLVRLSVCVDGCVTRGHVSVVRFDGEFFQLMADRSDPADIGFPRSLVDEYGDRIVEAACQAARETWVARSA